MPFRNEKIMSMFRMIYFSLKTWEKSGKVNIWILTRFQPLTKFWRQSKFDVMKTFEKFPPIDRHEW